MRPVAQQLRALFPVPAVRALYQWYGQRGVEDAVLTLRDCMEHDGWPLTLTVEAIEDEAALMKEANRQARHRRVTDGTD